MKGIIYKIINEDSNNIYIGSTKQTLKQRLREHKSNYKKYLEGKIKHYTTSFDLIKEGNYNIILVEELEYNTLYELKQRERFYIETLDCVNKTIPNRTKKEYKEDNREYFKQKNKEYRENNKERRLEYNKQWKKQRTKCPQCDLDINKGCLRRHIKLKHP